MVIVLCVSSFSNNSIQSSLILHLRLQGMSFKLPWHGICFQSTYYDDFHAAVIWQFISEST